MTYGDAGFFGSTGALHLVQPIVGITPTPDGGGYWLVAREGGVFSFGDAGFFGSTGAIHLAQPIVALTPTADGAGYWLVAKDGGIFTFGDAAFHGSTGALHLAQPIASMAATPDGGGYWLMASDGGVFAFGDAAYAGSLGANPSLEPAERIVASDDGGGYWVVLQNGTSYGYGDASGAAPTQGLMFSPATPGDRAVLFAFAQLGKPYIWGGNGPVGYDCSGLALASWTAGAGVRFARVANAQYHTAGQAIDYANLVAGDLVFWGSDQNDWSSVYHTALYVGGGRIVEATGDHVQLNSLGQWGQSDLMPHGDRP
jgi:cell wall-associated NlpC family hydrolase